jgi:hypothetical protein
MEATASDKHYFDTDLNTVVKKFYSTGPEGIYYTVTDTMG